MPAAEALVEQWRAEFVRVMEAMSDVRPEMEVRLALPIRTSDMLWWNQPLDLAAGAEIWIGTPTATFSALGRRILEAAGISSAGPDEIRDAYLEVLRQSLGVLAGVVSSQVGRAITATAGAEQEPVTDATFGCQVAISDADQELPGLAFFVSQEMLEALEKFTHAGASGSTRSGPAPDEFESGSEFPARACGTLDLLLDLEMPVSVSFGRTQVRIQNILKLTTGSIIEMDRSISEPVEIIVNNCTIARGEVVVVDGNYGVRIQEVMSRKERLQESRKYLLPSSSARH